MSLLTKYTPPLRPVFVCKDLPGYEHRRLDGPQQDAQGLPIGKSKGIDGLKAALRPFCLAQGDRARGFEHHDKVVA